jgi:NADPH:quinone reductase-like Zn-dependent oxidoreductase
MLLSYGGSNAWFGPMGQILQATALSRFGRQKLLAFTAHVTRDDLLALTALVESGKVTPVIDRTYPLDEGRDAMAYLETGHARGKIVLTA